MTVQVLFEELLHRLRELSQSPHTRGSGGLSIAFSGGLDSRFLAHAALQVLPPERVELLHVTGPHIPESESAWAARWAKARGCELTLVPLNPLEVPEVAQGDATRCYACKKRLFTVLLERARFALCDGSNASDMDVRVFRPGLKALRELGIHSPLAEVGLEKTVLREIGRATGLERPDQQARPCLLTRLPYGVQPTAERLQTLAAMEEVVEGVLKQLAPERAEAWDFRIRLAVERPEHYVLQVGHELTCAQQQPLKEALSRFGPCEIIYGGVISGYFDATRPRA